MDTKEMFEKVQSVVLRILEEMKRVGVIRGFGLKRDEEGVNFVLDVGRKRKPTIRLEIEKKGGEDE
jgi:hypothetical protein